MLRSLFNGVSGLRNHQVRLDVIGNNIANVNTIGFKAGRVTFEETLAQTLQGATRPPGDQGGINPIQVGLGMSVGGIDTILTQGSLESTGQQTDLAIQGSGFFVVSDGRNRLFTRSGSFQFDARGSLVAPTNGWKVQGILADKDGNIPSGGDITDISLPFGQKAPAKATTTISYACNLDASAKPLGTILETQRMLALAKGTDKLTNLYNTSGQALGLSNSDEVIFKVNATKTTNMIGLSNSEGTMLDISDTSDVRIETSVTSKTSLIPPAGNNVSIIDIDNANKSITFAAGNTVTINVSGAAGPQTFTLGTDFNTFGELANLMQTYLNTVSPGCLVKMETDGSFMIDNKGTSALTNLSITSSNALFNTALSSISSTIAVNSASNSNKLHLYNTYRAGTDFTTLESFAARIEEVLGRASIGVDVNVNTGNAITVDNTSGNSDLYGIKIYVPDKTIFNNAMIGIIDDIPQGSDGVSTRFCFIEKYTIGSDFETLAELAAKLDASMKKVSSGATVKFQNGKFIYDNSTGSENLSDLSITSSPNNGKFQQIMGIASDLSTTSAPDESMIFLDVASATDELVNLYSATGASLGLNAGDDISLLTGRANGRDLPQSTVVSNMSESTTLQYFINQLKTTLFGSTPLSDEKVEITSDGKIKVSGAKGLQHEITGLTLGSGQGSGDNTNVNFSSTVSFNTVQKAKDITHAASIVTYDTLGERHTVKITFTKSDVEKEWKWEMTLEGNGPEEIITGNTGKVTFNNDGSLRSFTYDNGASAFEFNPGTGAETVRINLDPGELGSTKGITGFASPSTTVATSQDGYAMGNLDTISVDNTGLITGIFTNGVNKVLAQIALAVFNNPGGLTRVGDNMFQMSGNSGDAVIGVAGKSIQSKLTPGALEMSNVDLAQEFTSMIIAQRGFQANARVITTSDEMLTELVNLKR